MLDWRGSRLSSAKDGRAEAWWWRFGVRTDERRRAGPADLGRHQRLTVKPAVAVAKAGNEASMCIDAGVFAVHTGAMFHDIRAMFPNIRAFRVNFAAITMNPGAMFPNIRSIRVDFAAETMNTGALFDEIGPQSMNIAAMFGNIRAKRSDFAPMLMVPVPMFMNFGLKLHAFEAKRTQITAMFHD
ncbi:MAG TPA: hypothetical protein VGT79_00950 [Xanthomonadaceae bacterium]|nr:hypothetical protein [Xanthomonadaceae bacterium]